MRLHTIAVFALALVGIPLHGEVRLPKLLSDHAVLQRDQPVRIWGWAEPSEQITLKFHSQTVSAVANRFGEWEGWLRPESAGGPYTLEVSGSATAKPIQRVDILMGDVWVASGQSNMEFPLKGFNNAPLKDGEKEIAAATHPTLRLLLEKRAASVVALSENESTWTLCTPETAKNFSAVAYFFGREISEREHVPIGLIDASWGGTPAHSWISPQGIAYENLTSVYEDAGNIARDQGRADEIRSLYAKSDADLRASGRAVPSRPPLPNDHTGTPWTPGILFNGMIAPVTKYAIKGVIWYQGEADGGPLRGPNYSRVFGALIKDWRRQWGEGDYPFLYVQLSSFETSAGWGDTRDSQRRVLGLANTGMAVTLDVGLPKNVHPPDKQTVAARLALAAIGPVYGGQGEFSSPQFLQATTETGSMRVWLTHAEGLTSHGMPLGDFEVAGEDHVFSQGTATLETVEKADTVVVRSDKVSSPKYVRYAWAGVVTHYLYNASGLPLGTFTSEP